MKIALAGATHPGKHRDHNEDAFQVFPERAAAVVADGMGGLARGEVASRLVVESVAEALARGDSPELGIQAAHRRIRDTSIAAGSERMGSTAVSIAIDDDSATVYWVGDSRAYLWRGGRLTQVTKDHSFVADLIDAGAITAQEAETHPNRNVLTRAVGIRDTAGIKVDTATLTLQPGDGLLLCSDGLHGYLSEAAITDCMAQADGAEARAQALIARTLSDSEAGDNVTVVCAVVET